MKDVILHGDCLERLKELPDESVDLIVTDPPYGIGFMGKAWDTFKPEHIEKQLEYRKEQIKGTKLEVKGTIGSAAAQAGLYDNSLKGRKAFYDFMLPICVELQRVLKPGGFMFMNMTPRQDCLARVMLAIEDAGFETGFTSMIWTYASGFPKAANTRKQLEKRRNERAGEFDGAYSGFQPKPAYEPIIVAMKPLSEKTYVDQALKNGKGITWLMPDCGIPSASDDTAVSALEHALDSASGTDVASLLKVVELLRGESYPTTSCNKNCTDHDRHAFDTDCTLGKELSQWLASVQTASFRPPSNESEYGSHDQLVQDSLTDCLACRRFYGGQPQSREVVDQEHGKQPLDVLSRISRLLKEHSDNHSTCTALLSKRDAFLSLVRSYTTQYTRNGQKLQRRFPANLLVSDDVLNDGMERKSGKGNKNTSNRFSYGGQLGLGNGEGVGGDSGSYSRYFSLDAWAKTLPFLIVPKASKSEKNRGLEGFEEKESPKFDGGDFDSASTSATERKAKNHHPTVKPLKLMSYLITLGSREGDLILDPFAGSGTTCLAAKELKRAYIGIEREEEYVKIAEARLQTVQPTLI